MTSLSDEATQQRYRFEHNPGEYSRLARRYSDTEECDCILGQ